MNIQTIETCLKFLLSVILTFMHFCLLLGIKPKAKRAEHKKLNLNYVLNSVEFNFTYKAECWFKFAPYNPIKIPSFLLSASKLCYPFRKLQF